MKGPNSNRKEFSFLVQCPLGKCRWIMPTSNSSRRATAVLSSQRRCVALKVYIGKAAFWRSSSTVLQWPPAFRGLCVHHVSLGCIFARKLSLSLTARSPLQPPFLPFFRVFYVTTSSNSSTIRTALLLCNGNSFGAFFCRKTSQNIL